MKVKVEKVTVPLAGILNVVVFLAFFFAKIYDKIDWSWWWVFSPLWIPLALCFGIVIIFAIIYSLVMLFAIIYDSWKKKR